MIRLARFLGTTFGIAFLIARLVRPRWTSCMGALFALAIAHTPANACAKHASRVARNFRYTQPNRMHRRAKARGQLALS